MITKKQIIPAILSANPMMVINQAKMFDGLADVIQLDVIDGQFVNNVTCRPTVLENILTKTKVEVHLMVARPESWLNDCLAVKASRVYLQVETIDSTSVINNFKQNNIDVFLALNPETPIEVFTQYKDYVDGCLLLAVKPGKQGQKFIPETLEKITFFKEDFPDKIIVVDGGVDKENIADLCEAGADWLVCGSSIFANENPIQAYNELKGLL